MVTSSLVAELTGRYVGRQYLDNTGNKSRSLNPYAPADARLAWQPKVPHTNLFRLTLTAANVFSIKYESNGYTGFSLTPKGGQINYNYYFPQAPLTILAGLEIGF